MPTPSPAQQQPDPDHAAMLERQLKQERLDLIRSMAAQIGSPDVIDSHAHAFVRVQTRLEMLREERIQAASK
jgi:hypothetical protein